MSIKATDMQNNKEHVPNLYVHHWGINLYLAASGIHW